MTRKDYVMISAALAKVGGAWNRETLMTKFGYPQPMAYAARACFVDSAEAIADALQADNPRFDRERFLKACAVTQ